MEHISESSNFMTSQKCRDAEILMKISQGILKTMDCQEILQIISDGLAELLEIESAAIYLLQENNSLYLGATTPPLPTDLPKSLRYADLKDHPFASEVIKTKKELIIKDCKNVKLSPAEKELIKGRNLKSLMFFPFIQKDNILGVLILGTVKKSKIFTKEQINVAHTIANQLSVAVHNARLHETLQDYSKSLETLVQEKTKELDITIKELQTANENLFSKNNIIKQQNIELRETLNFLKDSQLQLIEAEKMASLGTLTAGVAHEINNPLNFLSGGCIALENFIEENQLSNNKELKILLESMHIGIDRISNIVKGLNQFSRQNTQLDEECDIHSIINNCLVMLNYQIKNNLSLKTQFCDKKIVIQGNVGMLHQVFMNILLNSIQAIDTTGAINIKTRIKGKNKVIIEISDTGHGIDKNNLKKITDPFFTTKDPGKGTGLGLSISNNIIKEHAGKLEFESKLGKGTTVRIVLPYNAKPI